MILTTSHGPQSHYECTPGAGSTGQHRTRPLSMGSPRSTQEERTSHVTATAPQAGALRGGDPHQEALGLSRSLGHARQGDKDTSPGADTATGTTSTSGALSLTPFHLAPFLACPT